MISLDWKELVPLLTIATILGAALIQFVRVKLGGEFVHAGDLAPLAGRLSALETKLGTIANHGDVRDLGARVGAVERGVDIVSAEVRGLAAQAHRIERQVTLLTEHLLKEPRA